MPHFLVLDIAAKTHQIIEAPNKKIARRTALVVSGTFKSFRITKINSIKNLRRWEGKIKKERAVS